MMRMGSGDFGKSKSKDYVVRSKVTGLVFRSLFWANLATSLEITKVVGNEVKLRDQDSTKFGGYEQIS